MIIFGLLLIFASFFLSALQEKPLVVVIPSYNNSKTFKKTLDSVFNQHYSNYRVIYIDDASTDGTGTLVHDYIKLNSLQHKTTLIHNNTRQRKLKNIYNAIHSCHDWEIVVQIDGDDWLAHNGVFALINKLYTEHDIWLTYGQYRNIPKEEALRWHMPEIGRAEPVPQSVVKTRSFRSWKWVYMHLRTFYAWLFKQIQLKDLLTENVMGFKGKFYPASNDLAIMYPMVEMAADHFLCVTEPIYMRNIATPIIGFKVDKSLQQQGAKEILKKKAYLTLSNPVPSDITTERIDFFVYANNSNSLATCLSSMYQHVKGFNKIIILYESRNIAEPTIKKIQTIFPQITSIALENRNLPKLKQVIETSQNYVAIIHDNIYFRQHINCKECVRMMKKTFTQVIDLSHGKYTIGFPYELIEQKFYAYLYTTPPNSLIKEARICYRNKALLSRFQHVQSIQEFINLLSVGPLTEKGEPRLILEQSPILVTI